MDGARQDKVGREKLRLFDTKLRKEFPNFKYDQPREPERVRRARNKPNRRCQMLSRLLTDSTASAWHHRNSILRTPQPHHYAGIKSQVGNALEWMIGGSKLSADAGTKRVVASSLSSLEKMASGRVTRSTGANAREDLWIAMCFNTSAAD